MSGFERRVSLRAYPLYEFEFGYDLLRSDTAFHELQDVQNFFLARNGTFDSFKLDESYTPDNSVTDQLIGTGNGSATQFQLVRTLTANGFAEPCMNPNVITAIKDNGNATSNYTTNGTGLITFNSPPVAGHTLTATFSYYFRCRFGHDEIDFAAFAYNRWSLSRVTLVGSLGLKV